MNLNLDKINFSALAMMLLVGLFLALSSCEQEQDPQGFVSDVPECQDLATVEAWVFLTYVAEVHPDRPGLPSGYTAAIKVPLQITQVVPIKFKESDESILSKLRSPWPDDYLIGQIKSYKITRKFCKETPEQPQDKPNPKNPSKQLSDYMQNRKIVLPDAMENKEQWMAEFLEMQQPTKQR